MARDTALLQYRANLSQVSVCIGCLYRGDLKQQKQHRQPASHIVFLDLEFGEVWEMQKKYSCIRMISCRRDQLQLVVVIQCLRLLQYFAIVATCDGESRAEED